jgi:hypothetical protein
VRVNDVWASFSTAEDTVVAASGLANAWYFANRARASAGSRRLAGSLLTALSGGAAAVALALLAGDYAEGWSGAIARMPLMLGSAATFVLVAIGRRQ